MNNVDRAKQFLPFDALKGLQEEIKAREKKIAKENKRELTEEEIEDLSKELIKINKGDRVYIKYFDSGLTNFLEGVVERVDFVFKFLVINANKIFFNDIYNVLIK